MRMAFVRVRVEELVSEPAERIRAGIDAEFLMLRNRVANEDLDAEGRANVELPAEVDHGARAGLRMDRGAQTGCPDAGGSRTSKPGGPGNTNRA